jgi:cell division septation protein DedD
MATNPEQDEYLDEDERDDIAQRSIFSAGWFRALLVLTVLAIVVVVSLPYLLNWLEPTPTTAPKPQTKAIEPAPAPPAPPAPAPTTGTAPSAKPETTAPPATAQTEAPKPAPAAPTPADRPLGTAPLPATPPQAPPAATGKTAPAKPEAVKPPVAAAAPKRVPAPAPAAGGSYWIQVGAFVQEKNAETLAKTLRAEQFPVEIARLNRGGGSASAPAPAKSVEPGGQNQLVITGSTPDAVNAALKGKGTAQVVKGGIVVNPSYDLETAMSLSSALKKEGFKVVIRRARNSPAPAPAARAAGNGTTYHVVRVGGFADRAKALQARADLEAKGHAGFLTQGAPR